MDNTKEQIAVWNQAIATAAAMLKDHAKVSGIESYIWAAQLVEDMLIEREP